MSSFLKKLDWRHATKAFSGAKIADSDLNEILRAVRLAPTSFGLQPFHVHVISNPALQEKIAQIGWNQKQYSTASHILAFVADTDINKRIEDFFTLSSGGNPEVRAKMKGYEDMMRGFFKNMSPEKVRHWAERQAYIAFGFAMAACAELGVDSCPMEGFSPPDLDKLLGVPQGHYSVVMLTVGQRDPAAQVKPKVRFPDSELFRRG
jgi:nitroreductase